MTPPVLIEIKLLQKQRTVFFRFDNGEQYTVFSASLVLDISDDVNLISLQPADDHITFMFDNGISVHYDWPTLYHLASSSAKIHTTGEIRLK